MTPEQEQQQFNDHVGKTPLEMVTEYHKKSGLDVGLDFWDSPVSLIEMRLRLIKEEHEEFREELDTNYPRLDYLLKEMADLIYVVYGMAVTYGWDLDEALRRVHENNVGRMLQPDGTIKRREDGKIIKNSEYPTVDLLDLV